MINRYRIAADSKICTVLHKPPWSTTWTPNCCWPSTAHPSRACYMNCVTVWYGSITEADKRILKRVIKIAQKTVGCLLPTLSDITPHACLAGHIRLLRTVYILVSPCSTCYLLAGATGASNPRQTDSGTVSFPKRKPLWTPTGINLQINTFVQFLLFRAICWHNIILILILSVLITVSCVNFISMFLFCIVFFMLPRESSLSCYILCNDM